MEISDEIGIEKLRGGELADSWETHFIDGHMLKNHSELSALVDQQIFMS